MADIFNYAKEMHKNELNDVITAPFLYVVVNHYWPAVNTYYVM